MLDKLLRRFSRETQPAPPSDRLATALLLIELARADFEFGEQERSEIEAQLSQRFGLGTEEARELMAEAQAHAQVSVSLYDYVQALNARMQPPEKRGLMHMLWRVAYADGRVDPHEEYLLRKLAGLLYLSDADFIQAKLNAAL